MDRAPATEPTNAPDVARDPLFDAALDPLLDPPERVGPVPLGPGIRHRLRLLDTEHGMSRLWFVVSSLLALGLAACLATGANGPDDPKLVEPPARRAVDGFGEAEFSVQRPGSLPSATPFCGLLAETPDAHERGMMHRRDLSGYDAMVFRWGADQTSPFWNRNVPIALSVAWFDGAGRFVSSSDMAPCGDSDQCPIYEAAGPYRFALEVPKGGLDRFDVGPGAVLAVGGPCN